MTATETTTTEHAEIAEIIPPAGQITSAALPALVDETGAALALVRDDEWASVPSSLVSDETATSIPRLAVNRKSDGGFIMEGTGELLRSLDFVWMDRTHTRAWWPEAFGKGDAEPSCRSNDGVHPTPESPAQQPGWEPPIDSKTKQPVAVKPTDSCATCPHSQWNGDEPPACALAIEAMVGLPDAMQGSVQLARIRFSGMGFGPARRFWESFSARLPKRPPIAYVSRVTLEPEQTPNGVFLRPKFERVNELTVEQARPLIEERNARIGEWKDVIASSPIVDDDLSTVEQSAGYPAADEEPF